MPAPTAAPAPPGADAAGAPSRSVATPLPDPRVDGSLDESVRRTGRPVRPIVGVHLGTPPGGRVVAVRR